MNRNYKIIAFLNVFFLLSCYETQALDEKDNSKSIRTENKKKDKEKEKDKEFFHIAILNMDRILHESKAAKQIQNEIEIQRLKYEEEMKAQEENYQVLEKNLIDQQKRLKPEEFILQRRQFDSKIAEIHQIISQRREKLENLFNGAMSKIQEMIIILVRQMAAQHNYKLVIPKSLIIFHEDNLEITEAILKQLDEKLPLIDLKNL